jgi:hypothetical protein
LLTMKARVLSQTAPDIMETKSGGGSQALFGLPFLLAGLFVLQIPLGLVPVEVGGDPITFYLVLPIGFGFAVVGGLLVLARNGLVIDRRTGLATQWWGLMIPLRRTGYHLSDYDRVVLGFRAGDRETPDAYPVSLCGPGIADPLPVTDPTDYKEAHRVAEDLARFLGKRLEDLSAEDEDLQDPV